MELQMKKTAGIYVISAQTSDVIGMSNKKQEAIFAWFWHEYIIAPVVGFS